MKYLLILTAIEPAECSDVQACKLSDAEAIKIKKLINWLEAHAGGDWGHTLARFLLIEDTNPVDTGNKGLAYQQLLEYIALQSRYTETETPGEFYGARCEGLDKALGIDPRMAKPVIIENSWNQFSPIEKNNIKKKGVEFHIEPTERLSSQDRAVKLTELTCGEFEDMRAKGAVLLILEGYDSIENYFINEADDYFVLRPDWDKT